MGVSLLTFFEVIEFILNVWYRLLVKNKVNNDESMISKRSIINHEIHVENEATASKRDENTEFQIEEKELELVRASILYEDHKRLREITV